MWGRRRNPGDVPTFSGSGDVPTFGRHPHLFRHPYDVPTFWVERSTSPHFLTSPPFGVGRNGSDHSFTVSGMALGFSLPSPPPIHTEPSRNHVLEQHSL